MTMYFLKYKLNFKKKEKEKKYHDIFSQSPNDRHIGYFQFLKLLSNIPMKHHIHVFLYTWSSISTGKIS